LKALCGKNLAMPTLDLKPHCLRLLLDLLEKHAPEAEAKIMNLKEFERA
jgi:hypothetical protein